MLCPLIYFTFLILSLDKVHLVMYIFLYWKSFSNVCSNPQSIKPSILSKLHVGGEYPWPIETPIETTKTTIKQ